MAAPATQKPVLATTNVVVTVGQQVRGYLDKGTLHLPEDYSVENALKSAYLALQEVKDRDGNNALAVCSQASIANALLDMVVQGLNPAKKQLYFIVYGKQLTCQRSYFGDQALAQRINPNIEIVADVVSQDDVFKYSKVRGKNVITEHTQQLENVDTKKIKAAYCSLFDKETGEDLGAEIMTWEQIQKSWGMSKTYQPSGNKGTHHDFPDQMALRTVIRRRCKPVINSSSDELLMLAIKRQDEDQVLAELDEREAIEAHGEVIDIVDALPSQNDGAVKEQPAAETKEPAAKTAEASDTETPAIEASAATLKLSEDKVTFAVDQLGDRAAAVLASCVADGLKTWKEIGDRIKSEAGGTSAAAAEEGPGY